MTPTSLERQLLMLSVLNMAETEDLALYHQTLHASSWVPRCLSEDDPFSFAHRSLLEGDERKFNGTGNVTGKKKTGEKTTACDRGEEEKNGLKREGEEGRSEMKIGFLREKKTVNKRKVKTPARRTLVAGVACLVKRARQNGDLRTAGDTAATPSPHSSLTQPSSPQHDPRPLNSLRIPQPQSPQHPRPSNSPLLLRVPQPQSPQHDLWPSNSPLLPSSFSNSSRVSPSRQLPQSSKQPQQGLPHSLPPLSRSPRLPPQPRSPRLLPLSRSPKLPPQPRSPMLPQPQPPKLPVSTLPQPAHSPHLAVPQSTPLLPQLPALRPLDLTTATRSPTTRLYSSSPPTRLHSRSSPTRLHSRSSPTRLHSRSSLTRLHSHSSPTRLHSCSSPTHLHSPSSPTQLHSSPTQLHPFDFSLPTHRNCHSLSPPTHSATPHSPSTLRKCLSLSPPTHSTILPTHSTTPPTQHLLQNSTLPTRSFTLSTQPTFPPMSTKSHSSTRKEMEEEMKRKKKACEVCGDVARSLHFGGRACDSCKAFFRRAVVSGAALGFVCSHHGSCNITLTTRRSCQACRFAECVRAGMEVSLVAREDEGSRNSCHNSQQQQQQQYPHPHPHPHPHHPPPTTTWASSPWHPHSHAHSAHTKPFAPVRTMGTIPGDFSTLPTSTEGKRDDGGVEGSNPTWAAPSFSRSSSSSSSSSGNDVGTELGPGLSPEDSAEVQQLQEAYFQAFERVTMHLGESDIQCEELGQLYTNFIERRAHFLVSTPHYHTLAPPDRPHQLHIAVAMCTYFIGAHLFDKSDFTLRKHRVSSKAAHAPLILTAATMRRVLSHQQFTHVMRFYTRFSNVLADETVSIIMQVMSLFHHEPSVMSSVTVEAGRRHYSSLLARYLVSTVDPQHVPGLLATLLACQHEARQLVELLQDVDLTPPSPRPSVPSPTSTLLTNLHHVCHLVQATRLRQEEATTALPGPSDLTPVSVDEAEHVMRRLAQCEDPATLASARAILPTSLLSRLLHLLQPASSSQPQSGSSLISPSHTLPILSPFQTLPAISPPFQTLPAISSPSQTSATQPFQSQASPPSTTTQPSTFYSQSPLIHHTDHANEHHITQFQHLFTPQYPSP